jgi:hypothetical protein
MDEIGRLAAADVKATGFKTDDVLRTLASPERPFVVLLDFNEDSAGSALDILNHLTRLESLKTGALRIVIALPDRVAEELRSLEFAHDIQRVPLAPMRAAEVESYIEHRLRTAGWRGEPLLTSEGCASIAESSSGKPSIINEICFRLLQKLSESENGRSDNLERAQKIPLDLPFVNSVLSVNKPAGAQPPDKAIDQIASPTLPRNRRAATVAGIVIILAIAIAGLWYEIATKASSARRVNISRIPTPAIGQHHSVGEGSAVLRTPAPATTAMGVAMKAGPAGTVGEHLKSTPRVVARSPATVLIRDAGYAKLVDQQSQKFNSPPLLHSTSAGPTTALSSAPAQPPRTAMASGQPATSRNEPAADRQTVQGIAAHELRLGDTYMTRGEYDQALLSFSRALAATPDDQEVQERIKRARRAKMAEENVLQ